MSGERIKFNRVIVEEQILHVSSVSTTFVDHSLSEKVDYKTLQRDRAILIRLAKSKGIKINYKWGTKRVVDETKDQYENEYAKYNAHFHLLATLWRCKVKKGLYAGYSEDKDLNAIFAVSNAITNMWIRNSALSQARAAYTHIKQLTNRVKNDNLTSISV
jgi:hypothetical protein